MFEFFPILIFKSIEFLCKFIAAVILCLIAGIVKVHKLISLICKSFAKSIKIKIDELSDWETLSINNTFYEFIFNSNMVTANTSGRRFYFSSREVDWHDDVHPVFSFRFRSKNSRELNQLLSSKILEEPTIIKIYFYYTPKINLKTGRKVVYLTIAKVYLDSINIKTNHYKLTVNDYENFCRNHYLPINSHYRRKVPKDKFIHQWKIQGF